MNAASSVAQNAVRGPAIGILITAIVGTAWTLMGTAFSLWGTGLASMETGPFADVFAIFSSAVYLVVSTLIQLAVGGFMVYAALQMMKLRGYGVGYAASIMAMIPCFSPCCVIGVPFGIWALVVLHKPEVKQAFA